MHPLTPSQRAPAPAGARLSAADGRAFRRCRSLTPAPARRPREIAAAHSQVCSPRRTQSRSTDLFRDNSTEHAAGRYAGCGGHRAQTCTSPGRLARPGVEQSVGGPGAPSRYAE